MTEVQKLLRKTHRSAHEIRLMPTTYWAQIRSLKQHRLVHCKFIAREYGVELPEKILNEVEAITHFKERLRRASG